MRASEEEETTELFVVIVVLQPADGAPSSGIRLTKAT